MAKKLNKNLVAALGVVGFTLTTVVGVLMVSQLKETDPQVFVRRAEEEAAKKEWTRAAAFYGQAYSVGRDAKYLVLKADMLYEMGKETDALKAYKQAVVIDPSLLRAQEQILKVQLEMIKLGSRSTESWRNVRETANAILELKEGHPRAIYALGISYLGLKELDSGNEAKGMDYLVQAVQLAPTDPDPSRELSAQYEAKNRIDEAEEILRNLVKNTPEAGKEAADARCLLASFLGRQNKPEEIEGVFADAWRLAGDDPEVQSSVQVRIGRYWFNRWLNAMRKADGAESATEEERSGFSAKAEAALRKSIEVAPEEFDGYVLLAELLARNDRLDEAIEVYKERLSLPFRRKGLDAFRVKFNRYRILLGLADFYTTLAGREAPGSEALKDLATEADMRVEEALGELPTGAEAARARGRVKAVLGKHRAAVKWYERSEEQSAGRPSWQTQAYLADSLIQLREMGRAREAILKAVAIPGAPPTCWLMLAKIQLDMKQPRQAITIANQILARSPGRRDALLLKAAAQEQLGQDNKAKGTIEQITDATPPILAARIQLLANQGRMDEAIKTTQSALQQYPAEPVLVRVAAMLYKGADRPDDANRVVDEALAKDPENFDLKLLALQMSDLTPEERRDRYVKMVNGIDDAYRRAARLAAFYANEGDTKNRLIQLNKAKDLIIASETPAARSAGETTLRSLVDMLFQVYAEEGNLEELDKLVAEATEKELDAAGGLSYQGRRLMVDGLIASQKARTAINENRRAEGEKFSEEAKKAYDKAIESLNMALEQYPSSGLTYAQLGEAYLQVGRTDEARIAFERAYDIMPRNGLVLKRLAAISDYSGNRADFERYLKECKKLMPNDRWVLDQFLVLDEEADPRAVIAKREKKREEQPDDINNLYALAELYHKVGDLAPAYERIDDILALRSDTFVVGRLAKLLRKMNAPDRALQMLQDHLRDAPADQKADAQLLIAEHSAALRLSTADTEFLAAADIDPNQKVCVAIGRHYLVTGRPSQASEWLQKAYDRAAESNSIEKASIQRLQIEAAIRLEDMAEAGRLCKQYISEYPEDPVGLFMDAQVSSGLGQVENAIEKLTRFLEKKPGNPLATYRRAEYLGSLGRWQQAISDLEGLRASAPDALEYAPRALLARAYTQIGRVDDAIHELENVFAKDPTAVAAVRELLDLYAANDRFTSADQVLATLLNKEPGNSVWLLRSAEIAVKQGDRTKALATYKEAAKLAGYPPRITVPLLEACRKKSLNAVEQGITYLEDTIPPNRRSPEVMLAYANLLADRGDTATAVETYLLAVHRAGFGASDIQEQVAFAALSSLGADVALEAFRKKPTDDLFDRANKHILSEALQQTGQFDESRTICDSLLETAGDDAEKSAILLRLAIINEQTNKLAEAKETYEKVLKLNPNSLVALNNLAFLLADKLGQADEAIVYAERAVGIAKIPDVVDTLGWVYLQAGRNRDAIAQFTKVREQDPNSIPATTHLAEALRRVGNFDSAIQLFDIVLNTSPGGPYAEYRTQAEEGKRKAQERSSD